MTFGWCTPSSGDAFLIAPEFVQTPDRPLIGHRPAQSKSSQYRSISSVDGGTGSLVSCRPACAVDRQRRQGRIRLEAQDAALSRRRSPIRIRYAVLLFSVRPICAHIGAANGPVRRV